MSRRQLIDLGITGRSIERRLETGRLQAIHRGVYAVGHRRMTMRGHWMAAVLAGGDGALLSHMSAACLWGPARPRHGAVDVLSRHGRRRQGIAFHHARLALDEWAIVDGVPLTTVARTVFDLGEVLDDRRLRRTFEEADRLGLLELAALRAVCARAPSPAAHGSIMRLVEEAPNRSATRSPLEDDFAMLCSRHGLPCPSFNVPILGRGLDALWPRK